MEISIHAPRVGCDQIRESVFDYFGIFQSTHPVWGATKLKPVVSGPGSDFNPRTPCGVRQHPGRQDHRLPPFQSTHPVWGATPAGQEPGPPAQFQSTHPVWGATKPQPPGLSCGLDFNPRTPCGVRPVPASPPFPPNYFNPRTPCGVRPQTFYNHKCSWRISIHAPRVGCDVFIEGQLAQLQGISIHAPRVGCDREGGVVIAKVSKFQSTHPVWGATIGLADASGKVAISIHAPRVGCDDVIRPGRLEALPISIHAPRVGCDPPGRPAMLWTCNFNPRTPCGVRRVEQGLMRTCPGFQSTHPVWGATSRPAWVALNA